MNEVEDRVFSCVTEKDLKNLEKSLTSQLKRVEEGKSTRSLTDSTINKKNSELKGVEARLNKKLSESIDGLGNII